MHPTPAGYPPLTHMEIHQSDTEDMLEKEDERRRRARFEEAPDMRQQIKQDAVQAIIAHCLDAQQEVKDAGHPPDEFHARKLVGYLRRTIQSILEECKRLT